MHCIKSVQSACRVKARARLRNGWPTPRHAPRALPPTMQQNSTKPAAPLPTPSAHLQQLALQLGTGGDHILVALRGHHGLQQGKLSKGAVRSGAGEVGKRGGGRWGSCAA